MVFLEKLHRQFALKAYEAHAKEGGAIQKLQDSIVLIRDKMLSLDVKRPQGLGHNGLPGEYLNVIAVNLTLYRDYLRAPSEDSLSHCLEDFFNRFSRPSKGSVNLPNKVPSKEISGVAIGRLIKETKMWLESADIREDDKLELNEALDNCSAQYQQILDFACLYQNNCFSLAPD